eukprot:CAMPEP_0172472424 /NCGR_PEP_ID=MMETSP1065-20121228/68318_1 /TAXON_ID=265537 /ORGANISM="Amphiprora paludosa, Strain CCMP125" /LENGTH=1017 /DNA_ID=CAMNT_0013230559 /DNA_START=356 /DNA_END=3407 /DNA_ORIENTATION=-
MGHPKEHDIQKERKKKLKQENEEERQQQQPPGQQEHTEAAGPSSASHMLLDPRSNNGFYVPMIVAPPPAVAPFSAGAVAPGFASSSVALPPPYFTRIGGSPQAAGTVMTNSSRHAADSGALLRIPPPILNLQQQPRHMMITSTSQEEPPNASLASSSRLLHARHHPPSAILAGGGVSRPQPSSSAVSSMNTRTKQQPASDTAVAERLPPSSLVDKLSAGGVVSRPQPSSSACDTAVAEHLPPSSLVDKLRLLTQNGAPAVPQGDQLPVAAELLEDAETMPLFLETNQPQLRWNPPPAEPRLIPPRLEDLLRHHRQREEQGHWGGSMRSAASKQTRNTRTTIDDCSGPRPPELLSHKNDGARSISASAGEARRNLSSAAGGASAGQQSILAAYAGEASNNSHSHKNDGARSISASAGEARRNLSSAAGGASAGQQSILAAYAGERIQQLASQAKQQQHKQTTNNSARQTVLLKTPHHLLKRRPKRKLAGSPQEDRAAVPAADRSSSNSSSSFSTSTTVLHQRERGGGTPPTPLCAPAVFLRGSKTCCGTTGKGRNKDIGGGSMRSASSKQARNTRTTIDNSSGPPRPPELLHKNDGARTISVSGEARMNLSSAPGGASTGQQSISGAYAGERIQQLASPAKQQEQDKKTNNSAEKVIQEAHHLLKRRPKRKWAGSPQDRAAVPAADRSSSNSSSSFEASTTMIQQERGGTPPTPLCAPAGDKWNERFQELREFKAKMGHCNVPHSYKINASLARWVKRQRHQYRILMQRYQDNSSSSFEASTTMIQQERGGTPPTPLCAPAGDKWNERFQELREFKAKMGHCNVPHSYKINAPLARWVKRQRHQYRILMQRYQEQEENQNEKERRQRQNTREVAILESQELLPMSTLVRLTSSGASSTATTNLISSRSPTSSGVTTRSTPAALAAPISSLTPERIEALQDLGFVWDVYRDCWQDKIGELRAYKEKHSNCDVPCRYAENPQLAIWVKCQRRQYKLYTEGRPSSITLERIRELEQMGFCW